MKRKIFGVFLLIVAALIQPLAASTEEYNGIQYSVLSDGTVRIDSDINKTVEGDLVIPAEIDGREVSAIATGAFALNEKITSLTVESPVTFIGSGAFRGCSNLVKVILPENLKGVEEYSFQGCTSLQSVVLPEGMALGGIMFSYCTNLNYVMINDIKDHRIKNGIFMGCSNLKKVGISTGITKIDGGEFESCTALSDVYYYGTEEQWNQIEIGKNNEPLLNAAIHFVIKPLEVAPITPVVNAETNAAAFPVTVVDQERAEELNEVELFVAEYDEIGRLMNVTRGTKSAVEGDTITITADIPETANYKFMLWDGNNFPLMDAVSSIQ